MGVNVRRSLVVPLFVVAATRVVAQTPSLAAPAAKDSLGYVAPAQRPGFGRNTPWILTGAVGVGVAVSMFDSRLLGVPSPSGDGTELHRTSAIGNMLGGPGPLAIGAALYAAGKGSNNSFLSSTGREVIRAVAVAGGITALTKGVVGRTRPFASPGDADEYSPGHGFMNSARASFPSGHTAAAFATATVLARELDVAHPASRWVVNPLLFGAASFVGWSRMYDHQHWPSDVLVGAALGSLTGYEVVAHAHGDRSPFGGALLSHLHLGPSRKGLAVDWSLR